MTQAIPKPSEFVKEAIVLVGGALLAAYMLSKTPELKAFIQKHLKGCDCEK